MVSRVGVSEDFRKQVLGYGLTTAQILYRMPDHPSLLQTYVWQNYDLFPNFPALKDFLSFWQQKLEGPLFAVTVAHSKLIKPAELRAVAETKREGQLIIAAGCMSQRYADEVPTWVPGVDGVPHRRLEAAPRVTTVRITPTWTARRRFHRTASCPARLRVAAGRDDRCGRVSRSDA